MSPATHHHHRSLLMLLTIRLAAITIRSEKDQINSDKLVRKMCPVVYVRSEHLVNIEQNLRKAETNECGQKKNKTPTKRKQNDQGNTKSNVLDIEDTMNDVDVDEHENNVSIMVYEEISPKVVGNEETINCDSENEEVDQDDEMTSGTEVGQDNEMTNGTEL
ncbi:hypothetical protein QVD17_16865 [Tagetes erecta]|uniref:Uncharacterized protein n=1 Tax=Tagetes erecta TaxID=13708 RepID=A0AAD8KS52_TARER|nr:hypothetical protein QVD17_16865 [Tagetes erecta]